MFSFSPFLQLSVIQFQHRAWRSSERRVQMATERCRPRSPWLVSNRSTWLWPTYWLDTDSTPIGAAISRRIQCFEYSANSRVVAFVGGFSYADVLGSAKGEVKLFCHQYCIWGWKNGDQFYTLLLKWTSEFFLGNTLLFFFHSKIPLLNSPDISNNSAKLAAIKTRAFEEREYAYF